MVLYLINALAVLFMLIGFNVAFRQKLVLASIARLRPPHTQGGKSGPHFETPEDAAGVASVLRIIGVMIMAFSFTAGAFANLIAYYTAASAG